MLLIYLKVQKAQEDEKWVFQTKTHFRVILGTNKYMYINIYI